MDWVAPHGPWDDSLAFIFDGGVLTAEAASRISLRDGELHEYRFCAPSEAVDLVRPRLWARLQRALAAIDDGVAIYLQEGHSRE